MSDLVRKVSYQKLLRKKRTELRLIKTRQAKNYGGIGVENNFKHKFRVSQGQILKKRLKNLNLKKFFIKLLFSTFNGEDQSQV